MKVVKLTESKKQNLFEGKKISFVPVHEDENGNLVDDNGVSIGARLSSGDDLRKEMDPFADGKNKNGADIKSNHYIPKADWDRMSNDQSDVTDIIDKTEGSDSKSYAPVKYDAKAKKKAIPADVWKNTGEISYENDDESDGGMVYQVCVFPKESPNYMKGRWLSFDEAVF